MGFLYEYTPDRLYFILSPLGLFVAFVLFGLFAYVLLASFLVIRFT
jgi:hypothetical protein